MKVAVGVKPDTPCREWQGAHHPFGYGQRTIRTRATTSGRTTQYIHRWVWEQVHGPIPPGMEVRHLCDNPPCFRYDHLALSTHAGNMADMHAKGRHSRRTGELNHNAKLTDDDVRAVRQLCDSGVSHREIGRRLGICHTVVTRINRRQSWAHVEDR